jgi:hypothetical protein
MLETLRQASGSDCIRHGDALVRWIRQLVFQVSCLQCACSVEDYVGREQEVLAPTAAECLAQRHAKEVSLDSINSADFDKDLTKKVS